MTILQTTLVSSTMIQLIDGAVAEVRSSASLFMTAARIIGGIGAMIWVVRKFSERLLREGEPLSLLDFSFPVMIALLLSVYPMVAGGIEQAFQGVTSLASQAASTSPNGKELFTRLTDHEKALKKDEASKAVLTKNTKADDDWFQQNASGDNKAYTAYKQVTTGASMLQDHTGLISGLVNQVLQWVFTLLGEAGVIIIYFISKIYITLYFVFGPLSIAFSLIPGFEQSITNWFQKYISFCLWPVLANVLEIIVNKMIATQNIAEMSTMFFIPLMVLLFGLFSIPKLASSILALSGPSGGAGRVIHQLAVKALTKT